MAEERLLILKMLDEGKISTDEAEKLLSALGEENKDEVKEKIDNFTEKTVDFSEKAASKGISLAESVMEGLSGFFDNIDEGNFSNIFSGKYESEFYDFKISTEEGENLNLDIIGSNGSISVHPGESKDILVNANVRYNKTAGKNKPSDGFYNVEREGKTVFFRPLIKDNIAVDLDIFLPEKNYENISIINKNAKVSLKNIISNKLEVKNKNSTINLSNIDSDFILTDTKNGSIDLDSIKSKEVNINTSNGKIILNCVNSPLINATTSNGLIDAEQLTTHKAFLATTNGSISVNTSDEFPGYFNLRTTSGKINLNLDSLVFDVDSETIKIGKAVDYDEDNPKEIIASTTNGSIRVG